MMIGDFCRQKANRVKRYDIVRKYAGLRQALEEKLSFDRLDAVSPSME